MGWKWSRVKNKTRGFSVVWGDRLRRLLRRGK